MNYIFVHINKCAGSSVKQALQGKVDHDHKTIYCIRRSMEATDFNNTFKFAFVRHPISRIQSMYRYRYQTDQHGIKTDGIGFPEWFSLTFIEKQLPYYNNPIMFEPCYNWISEDNEILVDYVGKVEHFNEDMTEICSKLGVMPQFPRINVSEPIDLMWTTEMESIALHLFKDDLRWY